MIDYEIKFFLPDEQDINHQEKPFKVVNGVYTAIADEIAAELNNGIVPNGYDFLENVPKCWVTITYSSPTIEKKELLFLKKQEE